MPSDIGVLTYIMQLFLDAISGGYGRIYGNAMWLLQTFSLLEVMLAAIWWGFGRTDVLHSFLKKIMMIGFFIFVVTSYPLLIHALLESFVFVGLTAGGNQVSLIEFTNPSRIASIGMELVQPVLEQSSLFHPFDALFNGFASLIIIVAFFVVAIQVFVTFLEFYIVAVLGLVLIPFGVLKHTSFMAEKVFGGILSFGVKLMVLSFIISVAFPVMDNLVIQDVSVWRELFGALLASLAIMMLAWQAPSLAASLLSGAPTLTAGSALGVGLAAGAGGAGAFLGAKAAGQYTGGLIGQGGQLAAKTAGVMSSGYTMGASTHSGGNLAKIIGGARGSAAALLGTVPHTGKEIAGRIAGHFRKHHQSGIASGYRSTGGSLVRSQASAGHNSGTGGRNAMHPLQAASLARQAIPHESGPLGSTMAPIKHREED